MEVEVLQWFVRPGDRVSQFDKLCEVQSDKVRAIVQQEIENKSPSETNASRTRTPGGGLESYG